MEIINWDIHVFEFINSGLSSEFFDAVLPAMREPLFWIPLYVFLLAFMLFNYGKKSYWFVLVMILSVGSSDIASSRIIKKTVQRVRPCNNDDVKVIKRVRCGSGYSFTSSHAANHFSLAVFAISTLGQHLPKIKPWLWFWAGLISFSQVYVGVHFPIDIICGAIVGIIIGKLYGYFFNKRFGYVLDRNIITP